MLICSRLIEPKEERTYSVRVEVTGTKFTFTTRLVSTSFLICVGRIPSDTLDSGRSGRIVSPSPFLIGWRFTVVKQILYSYEQNIVIDGSIIWNRF